MGKEQYPLALAEGTILNGRFQIGRVLGQGGFGITYIAKDLASGRQAAVKEYLPAAIAARTGGGIVRAYSGRRGSGFSYGRECFLKEAQTLAEFDAHPNIVHVQEYFEEHGTAYFVMDYVDGISFQAYIQEHGGKLDWQEAERLLLPIMDALEAVHETGMIHRDVTPDNIFITKDGNAILLDFGAARYSPGDCSLTLDVVLKRGFAPKEQYLRHGRQGPYTDVYALAATFYYAVTGRTPPDAIDRLENDPLILPSGLGMELPPAFEKALAKALHVQPSGRYADMAQFRRGLSGQAEEEPHQKMLSESKNFYRKKTVLPSGKKHHQKNRVLKTTKSKKSKKFKFRKLYLAAIAASAVLLYMIQSTDPESDSGRPIDTIAQIFGSICGSPQNELKTGSVKDENRKAKTAAEGNAISNILQDGIAVEDSQYRYYTTVDGLLRVSKAADSREMLDKDYADNLNLYDGWLYYLAAGSIRRIRPDGGSVPEQIIKAGREYHNMYIADGTAYLTYEEKPGSYRYALLCADMKDWSMEQIVSGMAVNGYTISGGWIYFRDAADQYFYKMRIDGRGGRTQLTKTHISSPIAAGSWIYGYTPDNSICRINAGSGALKMETIYEVQDDYAAAGMNLRKGRLYFYSGYDPKQKGVICSIKLDGTDYRELFTAPREGSYFHCLNFLNGEIAAAYCEAYRMTGTVVIDLKTGRQAVY